ncbi:MAG: PDZ domain-containing protein [Bauldia sp.]|nr:PDZ domain-containing protein [Bauldia sp.]
MRDDGIWRVLRRTAMHGLGIAAAWTIATTAAAQAPSTIALDVADWVPGFDSATGGWTAVPAGRPIGQAVLTIDFALAVEPGTYDIYWRHSGAVPALRVAAGIVVGDGVTTVPVASGAAFAVADWVVRDDPDTAGWGVVPALAYAGEPWLARTQGDAVFLPPGNYDFYWLPSGDATPIPVARQEVPEPFGGIGVEIQAVEAGMRVLNAAETQPAGRAGILPDDIIVAVDGTVIAGMTLAEAVALLRGTIGVPVVVGIRRGKGEPLELTMTREEVQPVVVVRADSGVAITNGSTLPALDPATGWWGAVSAGQAPTVMVNATADTAAPLLLSPGRYDLYWRISDRRDPFLVAVNIDVTAGAVTEVRIDGRLEGPRR